MKKLFIFVGEFGWEVNYWHAHLRWIKENSSDYIACASRKERHILYKDLDEFIDLPKFFYDANCKSDSYLIMQSDVNGIQDKIRAWGESLGFDEVVCSWELLPNARWVTARDFLKGKQSFKKLSQKFEQSTFDKHIVLWPRNRAYGNWKNWGGWQELVDKIKGDFDIDIVITGSKQYPLKLKNVIDIQEEDDNLQLTLEWLSGAKLCIGSISGAMNFVNTANLCPTVIFGPAHDKERNRIDENPLDNKCWWVTTSTEAKDYTIEVDRLYGEIKPILEELL